MGMPEVQDLDQIIQITVEDRDHPTLIKTKGDKTGRILPNNKKKSTIESKKKTEERENKSKTNKVAIMLNKTAVHHLINNHTFTDLSHKRPNQPNRLLPHHKILLLAIMISNLLKLSRTDNKLSSCPTKTCSKLAPFAINLWALIHNSQGQLCLS
jgi:hypothetical protein